MRGEGPPPPGEPRTVAIINDEPMVRLLTKRIVARFWPDVDFVEGSDGDDAIRLRFAVPTLVAMLIDGLMPHLNGLPAVIEIRRREDAEGFSRLPIIFESGDVLMTDAALAGPADARLDVPFEQKQIIAVLRSILGEPRGLT